MGMLILVRACYRPSLAKVKTFARVRDRKNKTFPSEYSFAICLISLAFLTKLCAEGDEKKNPLISSPYHYVYTSQFPYIYAIRRSQQFQPLKRSFLFFTREYNYFKLFILWVLSRARKLLVFHQFFSRKHSLAF